MKCKVIAILLIAILLLCGCTHLKQFNALQRTPGQALIGMNKNALQRTPGQALIGMNKEEIVTKYGLPDNTARWYGVGKKYEQYEYYFGLLRGYGQGTETILVIYLENNVVKVIKYRKNRVKR